MLRQRGRLKQDRKGKATRSCVKAADSRKIGEIPILVFIFTNESSEKLNPSWSYAIFNIRKLERMFVKWQKML